MVLCKFFFHQECLCSWAQGSDTSRVQRKEDKKDGFSQNSINMEQKLLLVYCSADLSKYIRIYYWKCTSDDLGSGPSILPLSSKKGFKNYVCLLVDKGMWVTGLWRSEALHLLGPELQAAVSHREWVLGAELRFFGTTVSTLYWARPISFSLDSCREEALWFAIVSVFRFYTEAKNREESQELTYVLGLYLIWKILYRNCSSAQDLTTLNLLLWIVWIFSTFFPASSDLISNNFSSKSAQ